MVRLSLHGQRLAAGLRNVQLRPADLDLYAAPRTLAAEASFLQVSGDLVLSSARRVGAALEVRLFNPTTRPADGELRLGRMAGDEGAFTSCQAVDLESNPVGERRAFAGSEVRVTLRPKEIQTLRLT